MSKKEMAMREALLDKMINIYGFEHEAVISFAGMIENPAISTESLAVIVNCHVFYNCGKEL